MEKYVRYGVAVDILILIVLCIDVYISYANLQNSSKGK